ncbi:hypothetical protein L249_4976 [Ophiocordyceps polyrhachis-furcata BCC 54312]|uniref:Allergen Asp F4-like protein n=1 Tax=Ophiocordyceps polyrhachis-furcata BCC 54312 TaxID=1330021 RepID=A0A367L3M5_9HYPO|nr:hypothetical protein L249_4976 [Ophiocordyceps polyrhachis-furcata BCC 54312]
MKTSLSALLLAAALGAVAHPSGHGHRHFHRSPKTYTTSVAPNKGSNANSVPDNTVDKVQIPPSPKEEGLLASAAAPLAPILNHDGPRKQSSYGGGGGSGIGPDSYEDFCGGAPPSSWKPVCPAGGKWKRATAADVALSGNLGLKDNYGCNLKLVKSNYAEKYDYTFRFKNVGNHKQACVCWLKIGPDGCGINGFWKGKEVMKFDIPAGAEQSLAIQADTKGGCACHKDEMPTTPGVMSPQGFEVGGGEWASTWLEFDMGSIVNGGSSGADASCLAAASVTTKKMDIPGMRVCREDDPSAKCSIIWPGGTGNELAYTKGQEALDGRSVNVGPGPVHYSVEVDYQEKN